jgi:Zn-finger nucleic acid-binding protein
MKCPRCKTLLHTENIEERGSTIEVDSCANCNGIWFDQGELTDLEKVTAPVLIEIRNIPSEHDQLTAMNCPKCEHHPRMNKAEHYRDEKVIIDVCESCKGIWLDGGELAAIQKENWFSSIYKLLHKMHGN